MRKKKETKSNEMEERPVDTVQSNRFIVGCVACCRAVMHWPSTTQTREQQYSYPICLQSTCVVAAAVGRWSEKKENVLMLTQVCWLVHVLYCTALRAVVLSRIFSLKPHSPAAISQNRYDRVPMLASSHCRVHRAAILDRTRISHSGQCQHDSRSTPNSIVRVAIDVAIWTMPSILFDPIPEFHLLVSPEFDRPLSVRRGEMEMRENGVFIEQYNKNKTKEKRKEKIIRKEINYQILVANTLQQFVIQSVGLIDAHFECFLNCAKQIVTHRFEYRLFITIGRIPVTRQMIYRYLVFIFICCRPGIAAKLLRHDKSDLSS